MSPEPRESRPDPDALLARVSREEERARRGGLKIFFGMAPGVGKTYAMLEQARARMREGVNVAVGLVETHGRAETAALLDGLFILPRRTVEYRGTTLEEFDLEEILLLRPELVLVDELAHTNAPGSRHLKRYQDILELLAAGIHVYSTLNVQHLESCSDAVRQITGVTVRETVPDSVLDQANEIELVDLSPADLRDRLEEGKVYLGDRAAAASENFFKEANLLALRELALRVVAHRVNQDLHAQRETADRVLVAVGPSPSSLALVRRARHLAYALGAPWVAVHVGTSRTLTPEERRQLDQNLALARELGGEVVLVHDHDIASALIREARQRQVRQIVVGLAPRRWWQVMPGRSLAWTLAHFGGGVEVSTVPSNLVPPPLSWLDWRLIPRSRGTEYLGVLLAFSLTTMVSLLVEPLIGYWAIAVIYLFTVLVLGLFVGRGPALLAATVSAVGWNFLFIPPRYTLYIRKFSDVLMFGLYFVIALVTGHLTSRIRRQQRDGRRREERAESLYRLVRGVNAARTVDDVLVRAVAQAREMFGVETAFALASSPQALAKEVHPASAFPLDPKERSVAILAHRNRRPTGRYTDTLPMAELFYLPVATPQTSLGVMAVRPPVGGYLTLEQRDVLQTYAGQIALVLEREEWRTAGEAGRLAERSTELHRHLLNSVSHELRTPLAVIRGAAEQLTARGETGKLASEIQQATRRLDRLVGNLLDTARLESGQLRPRKEWGQARELVTGALEVLQEELTGRRVEIAEAGNLPLLHTDFGLCRQALANILHNALRYGTAGVAARVRLERDEHDLILRIEDDGPGIAPELLPHIFEKFRRGSDSPAGGAGLGLSIAKGFFEAVGATLEADNRPGGGATFTVRFPIEPAPAPAELAG